LITNCNIIINIYWTKSKNCARSVRGECVAGCWRPASAFTVLRMRFSTRGGR